MTWPAIKAAALALVSLVAILALRPPAALEADAPAQVFSARRAEKHVQQIATMPHPMGSAAHARVRQYLLEQFRALGLQTEVQDTEVAMSSIGRIRAGRVQNVVARYRGDSPGPAVMVAAHYDSVPHSPAASDDGAGTASLIEIARALRSGPPLRRDVIFLVSDGEERGLGGALAFVREHAWAREVAVVLNLEARGVGGTVNMFDTTPEAGALIAALVAAPRPAANSLVSALAELLPNDTDLTAFQNAGLAGMAFAYAQGVEHYHRPSDDHAHLELASVQDHGDTALALVRTLAAAELPLPKRTTPVYFDIARRVLVYYSHDVARLLAGLSLGVFFLAARAVTPLHLALTVGRGALGIVAALVASSVLHAAQLYGVSLTQAARAGPWLLLTALGTALLVMRAVMGRKFDIMSGLGVFALLTLVTAVWAPGASFVFQWPLLIGSVGCLLRRDIAAVPAAVLLAPLAFTTWVAIGPSLVLGPVLCGALLICLVPELLTFRPMRPAHVAAAALLGLLAGQVTARIFTPQIEYETLHFAIDADSGRAVWLSSTAASLPAATEQAVPEFSLLPRLWVTPAANVPQLEPALVSHRKVGDSVELRITPRGLARCFELWQESGSPIRMLEVQQREIVQLTRFSPERDEQLFRLITADRSRATARLEYCGLQPGASVTVRLNAAPDTVLRLVEKIDGLPAPGRRRTAPDFGSDLTLVSQRVSMTDLTASPQ